MVRNAFKIPDKSGGRQRFQEVPGDIDFPPEKSLAAGDFIIVVVVVPSLAQRQEREPQAVLGFFARLIALLPELVHDGIDGECTVIEQNGAEEKSDKQSRQSRGGKHQGDASAVYDRAQGRDKHGEDDGRNEVMLIEPHQLGVFGVVADGFEVRFFEVRSHDPTYVRVPEAVDLHGVRVGRRVAVAVVMAVVGCPPERPLLRRSLRHEGDDELKPARGLVRLVREVAVIAAGDPEHSDHVQGGAHDPVEEGGACPDGCQGNQVHDGKRDFLLEDRFASHFGCYGCLAHCTTNRNRGP